MIQAPGRAGVRLDQANQLWPTSASVFLNPHLPLQQRVPSSLSLGGGLGQPKPAPRHEHTQSHTRTHCDLQNTLPVCLALCPPLASQPIESCPLQETQASPGSEAPPTTTRMAHHHRASLSEGPGPSPDGNPDDNRDWSSVFKSSLRKRSNWVIRGTQDPGLNVNAGVGTERRNSPSKVKRQTHKGGPTHHRLPHSGEQQSPGSQGALL